MGFTIFDFFFSIVSGLFDLIAWAADLGLRFFSALFSFGLKLVGAIFNLLLTPFTHGVDCLLDWAAMDLRGLFALVLWVLLGACALLAVFATGSNLYRKYQHWLK